MKTKQVKEQYNEIRIPILSGSLIDLTKFDFSFKDITIYDIQDKKFEQYVESLQPDAKDSNINFIRYNCEQIYIGHEKKYAIVKNKPREDFNCQNLMNVWRILLIIFPSDLQVKYIVYCTNKDGFIEASSMSEFRKVITGEYPGEPLFASEDDILEVNEFVKIYFDQLYLDNYVGITIENYLTSFTASHLHYQYLALCIALESIINHDSELSYRLQRTVAILVGQNAFNCNLIYKNIKKIYKLRSRIAHGGEYKITEVQMYLKPLKAIVSRLIIELIIHNVPDNIKLNEIITQLAFGDR